MTGQILFILAANTANPIDAAMHVYLESEKGECLEKIRPLAKELYEKE